MSSGEIGDGDLDGIEDSHDTRCGLVQLVANARFEHMWLDYSQRHRHTKLQAMRNMTIAVESQAPYDKNETTKEDIANQDEAMKTNNRFQAVLP